MLRPPLSPAPPPPTCQAERADNMISGSRAEQVEVVRGHIRAFKQATKVDKVVVLWTANTER